MQFIDPPLESVRSVHAVQPLRKFPVAGECRICEVHSGGRCSHIPNKVPMCLQAFQANGKLSMRSCDKQLPFSSSDIVLCSLILNCHCRTLTYLFERVQVREAAVILEAQVAGTSDLVLSGQQSCMRAS